MAKNVNLTADQRAQYLVLDQCETRTPEPMNSSEVEVMAAAAGTSKRKIRYATAIYRDGLDSFVTRDNDPMSQYQYQCIRRAGLVEAVRDGRMTVEAAYKAAKPPSRKAQLEAENAELSARVLALEAENNRLRAAHHAQLDEDIDRLRADRSQCETRTDGGWRKAAMRLPPPTWAEEPN